MKVAVHLALAATCLLSFACGADGGAQGFPDEQGPKENVASTDQALCVNYAGTGAVLASLAVATAVELRRWNAPVDFQWNATTGMLEVSPTGSARCYGRCRNVEALLALQKAEAHQQVTFAGGEVLNSYTLRSVLKTHYDRQTRCNNYWGEYATNGCWVEAHDLWYWKSAPGTCAVDNYFWANKTGTSTNLDVPLRLNYQLYFAGYPDNPFLNFRNNNSNVVIDPTVGLNEGDATSSGACAAVCTQYSKTSVQGSCCACNGVTKTFSRSPFSADMYLCR